jgi:naphthoate synthase/2-ketocyclohexanecarboxyl-CoA hydrolase
MTWTAWEKVPGFEDLTEVIYEKKYHTELEGGIARITINRPQRMNAFTDDTSEEMRGAFYDASSDPMIAVVVLTGAGDRAFCTGGDVAWEAAGGLEKSYWVGVTPDRWVRMCRKPVIAMVKGFCIGGGNHLAYHCDFTIAAENAIFGQNGPRVSSPADGHLVQYLVGTVGMKKAREIWMLCRRYTAQEALEMGLANKVVSLEGIEEEVDKWCEEILTLSPTCIQNLKATFDWEADRLTDYGLTYAATCPEFFRTEEAREGGQAFLEKRKPQFWKIRKAELEARKKT